MNSPLSHTPILRILLPFGSGILFSYYTNVGYTLPIIVLFLSLAAQLALSSCTRNNPVMRYNLRTTHILFLFLASFALGAINSKLRSPKALDLPALNGNYISGTINSISNTDKSMKITLHNDSIGDFLVTTRGCNYNLNEGDIIAFKANLSKVKNWGNPQEFDYAKYLYNNSIAYSQHINVSKIAKIGKSSNIIYTITNLRYQSESKILTSQLSDGAKKFLIAILLGNNKHLDKDVRTTFSQAGAAHILALSGLHIGVIALLIWWLLFPLDYLLLKKLRLGITLIAIVCYAIFTGLSPSVIRATIMVSFTFVAYILYRRNSSLNSLFGAALLILIFSPFSIFSISFQLSFITVGFLVVFSSTILTKIRIRSKLLNYITSSIFVSLVATAATAAITAYYFHTISLLSFISNIIILPWLPLFMIVAIAFLFNLCLNGEIDLLTKILNYAYDTIYSIVSFVSNIPQSHISDIYISFPFVILTYAALVALCVCLYTKRILPLITGVIIAISAVIFQIHDTNTRPTKGCVIFNSYSCTPILFYNSNNGYLWCPDDSISTNDFKKTYTSFLSYNKIDSIHIVDNNANLQGAKIFQPYASIMGKNIVVIANGKWKHYRAKSKIIVDYAIITKRYHADIATLLKIYQPTTIVLSGDLYEDRHDELKLELESRKIDFYSIKDEGAICLFQ